ncbi:MAG: hypothetical protein ABH825_04690 [Candidatus Omnitrophota bacterium]
MKIMEAIGGGFGRVKSCLNILGIVFAFNVIWNFVTLPFANQAQDLTAMQVNPKLVVLSIVFILINIFIQGGILGAAKEVISGGNKSSMASFANSGKKFYIKLLALALIIVALVIVSALVISLVFSLQLAVNNVAVNFISSVLAIVLGAAALCVLFLLFMSPYALVINDAKPLDAMKMSMEFMKKNVLKMLGIVVLLVLVGLGIGFLVGIIVGLVALALKGAALQIISGIVGGAVNAYLTILITLVLMGYYTALSKPAPAAQA